MSTKLNSAVAGNLIERLLRCGERHITREVRTMEITESEARYLLGKISANHLLLVACQRAFEQTDRITRGADWELFRRAIEECDQA